MAIEYGPRRLRASDEEREQVALIVRAAMTEGRLTLPEGEERLASVYAARFRDELDPLTADLPDGGRRALADTPDARLAARRDLRRHGMVIAAVSAALVGLWALSDATFFWPAIPLVIFAVGFVRHARHPRHGDRPRGRTPWWEYSHGRPHRWS